MLGRALQAVIAFADRRAIVFHLCSFVAWRMVEKMQEPVRLSWLVERRLGVWVWCESCSHHKVLATPPLVERFGDAALLDLRRKFRCVACGGREIFIRPDWHGAGWTRGVVSRHDKLPE